MGKALELLTLKATAPGAGASLAFLTGNSGTIRAGRGQPRIIATWQTRQGIGFSRLLSPMLHDATNGFQVCGPVGLSMQFSMQPLVQQDVLTGYGTGSGTAGDIEHASALVYYPGMSGVDGNFISAAEFRSRRDDVLTQNQTISTGTTGEYTGSELITADGDLFKAGEEYAIIGAVTTLGVHAIRVTGPDWGGIGFGMPGAVQQVNPWSSFWFLHLAELHGLPVIPVMTAGNKALTYVDAVVDENGADPFITWQYVRLKK